MPISIKIWLKSMIFAEKTARRGCNMNVVNPVFQWWLKDLTALLVIVRSRIC